MVVKHKGNPVYEGIEFESRVILDGSQTESYIGETLDEFESRVILDGSQTETLLVRIRLRVWESCYFRW